MNGKIEKILNLLTEAKELMADLEKDLKVENKNYDIPIESIIPDATNPFAKKFFIACARKDIKTIGDLVNLGSLKFAKIRNVGNATLQYIKELLYEQYKIVW